ncbi:hypothetical protein KY337_02710 [Candidatus Woesearchaeota archaeon]|nr:hypothetical protein [Candidatus Woesearchaeota archaeon]
MGEDIKITYETIFELLRNERNKPELQKLEDTYFQDIVSYLNEKTKVTLNSDELFAENERLKTEKQIQNIKRMLRDLYDKRESKIVTMALNKARTGSNIIDTSALLKEEKELFESLCDIFSRFRKDVLLSLVNAKVPELKKVVVNVEDKLVEVSESNDAQETGNKMVRFLHAVPKFVGKDLEVYGPFDEEDVANLPGEIADILVLKQRAEEIKGG